MKFTEAEVESIISQAITSEMKTFENKAGGQLSLMIALLGASIGAKIHTALFPDNDDNEIEIVTDKE